MCRKQRLQLLGVSFQLLLGLACKTCHQSIWQPVFPGGAFTSRFKLSVFDLLVILGDSCLEVLLGCSSFELLTKFLIRFLKATNFSAACSGFGAQARDLSAQRVILAHALP